MSTHNGNGRAPAAGEDFVLSSVPPDVAQRLEVVAAALADEDEAPFALAPPPPPVDAGVEEVPEDDAAPAIGLAAGDPEAPGLGGGGDDVLIGHEVVEPAVAAATADTEPPDDAAPRAEERRKAAAFDDAPVQQAGGAYALPPALTLPEMYRVVRTVAQADSGDELYSAVLADADHAAVHGLAWGLALFTQASGRLGSVLRLTQRRDAALFDRLFGPDALAVLQVTNAETPEARLGTVSGLPLTDPSWVDRFRAAGEEEACRNAQNEEAIAGQLQPVARYALALGLDTDRGLAMAYDRVVAHGLRGGLRWLVDAAGLLASEAQRRTALLALGHADLAAFRAAAGLAPAAEGEEADAETVCLLLEALRAADAVPLPTAAELQDRLVAAATGAGRRRLLRLRATDALTDLPYRDA